MTNLLHELVFNSAQRRPEATAIVYRDQVRSYQALAQDIDCIAAGFLSIGLQRQERVGVYLDKRIETVSAIFATSRAGGVFVPINPFLKAEQVCHILVDCNVRVLITSKERLERLADALEACQDLHSVIVLDPDEGTPARLHHADVMPWDDLKGEDSTLAPHRVIDVDIAAILYTSGSTGKPKGVVLSHRNMVAGAQSVADYLENTPDDRMLAALPLSFDAGFSQLSTAFWVGASVVLMNYLFPQDIIRAVSEYEVTGLGAVPPLWIPLARQQWPENAQKTLRYITNTGGAMPRKTLDCLRTALPTTRVYLMYGLTEAFRSTYLPPEELDRRPDSMGKAIPNAEIMVVRPDGSAASPNEPGELVHRGALVAQGYWNDPERTAERFKSAPGQDKAVVMTEFAVWSGDTVRKDEDGFLYFIGRKDEMIKTSGYRVSPTEIEEVIYETGLVAEVATIGVPHPDLGQAIIVVVAVLGGNAFNSDELLEECKLRLPNFMVPAKVEVRESLPRNPNGKIDRKSLAVEFSNLFTEGDL